ncbi:MAG: TOBE domain-containing protein [bacterium]
MKLSARNVLNGTIKKIVTGAINSEIIVDLGNGIEITSIITKASAENLKLKEGKNVSAVIKATNVIIGVEED